MTPESTVDGGRLSLLDVYLCNQRPFGEIHGITRFVIEFLYFGIKEARACLFAGLFFVSIFIVPRTGVFGIPRYDVLLIIALAILAPRRSRAADGAPRVPR